MKNEVRTISFEGQNIYVGIDTHLKSWRATIMLEHSIHKTFSMNPNEVELARYLKVNFPGGNYFSAYEASFCGYSIHRKLEKQGIKNIILNPADIPTTDKERKQKEDSRDSRKIAKCLRNGDLEGIYIPSEENMEFRSLVRYRKTLVKEIARAKNRIKSVLYFNGITIPKEIEMASKYWSGAFTKWLLTVDFKTNNGKEVLAGFLEIANHLRKGLLKINKILRNFLKEGKYSRILQLLTTIPGIGLISASTFIAEIEDIHRFKNLDKFCSYVGLIPKTNSSGEKDIVGNITPRSNKPLRSVIIEAAWIAVRLDPSMALSFNELCKRMSKNKAIIRVAKKLMNRIRYVMKNEIEYVYAVV